MKLALTILVLPAALALPSYNGLGHGHGHTHAYGAYKSGYRPSGAPFSTGTAPGPYGISNATATQAASGVSSLVSTGYVTIHNTIYETIGGAAPATSAASVAANGLYAAAPGASEAASAAGGAGGSCAAAVTVTEVNTVTTTVTGGPAPVVQAPTSAIPSSTAEPAVPSGLEPPPAQSQTSAAVEEAAISPSSSSSSSSSSSTPVQAASVASPPVRAASTAPSAAPAAPATNSKSTISGKRGLLIPAGSADQAAMVAAFNPYADKIKWVANWFSSGPPDLNPEIEFVPQCYGWAQPPLMWTQNAETAIKNGEKYFLSFGEPETIDGQKDAQGAKNTAAAWMKYLQPYTDSVTIGAPGTLQSDVDFEWIAEFLTECENLGCKIGFINVHWFYTATPGNVQNFKDVVNRAIGVANGKPVWVDNFQSTGTNEAQQAFLQEVVPWMEANDAIERYAYVTPDRTTGTGLINTDGSISSLGEFYVNL